MRKWMILIALMVGLLALPVFAQDEGGVHIVGGDDPAALQNLLAHIVTPAYSGAAQGASVYVGALPPGFDLPYPDAITVIGSVVSSGELPTQVFFQTTLSPQEVHDFYTDHLTARDWHEPAYSAGSGGFVTAPPSDMLSFCSASNDQFVSVYSRALSDATDVTLYYQQDLPSGSQCAQPQMSGGQRAGQNLIPPLITPEGATQRGSSAGGSSDQWYSGTQLVTSLTPAELAQHYGDQLEAAGWTQLNQSGTDQVANSIWSLKDAEGNPWNGILTIIGGNEQTSALLQLIRVG